MEPIPLFTDTGCRTGHCAARRQAPLRFVFQSDQDYSGRDAPWRRCCCGGGEPWDCARRAGRHGDPTGDYGPEAVDAFGAPALGRCAAARYVRVRRPGNRPAGDAGTESVRREGRACHGRRPPGPGPPCGQGGRRGDGRRSRAGKLLAAPIRGRRGFTLSNPGQASSRSGEPRPRGLHSLSRLATTGTVDPGAGCAIEARRGGPLLAPRARRPTTRSKPWGMRRRRVRRSCGRRVHPSPQADIIQRGCQTERSGGGRKACWLWHVLLSAS